ncbi:MAG: hypothetical protein GEU73_03230 [Chloroflexi bacterium]|nr:hypothetical protein [Chloroflexota bacterium]
MSNQRDGTAPASRDALLLYCPLDRKVTRHIRREPGAGLVCVECGRRLDVLPRRGSTALGSEADAGEEQRTALVAPVDVARRPVPSRRSGAVGTIWGASVFVVVVAVVAVLAAINVVAHMMAPASTPTQATVLPTEGNADSPAPSVTAVRIANTDGLGAYIRRTPNLSDRLRVWPEGTQLTVAGPDAAANGLQWKQVTDPAGNHGWIPAQYTAPV